MITNWRIEEVPAIMTLLEPIASRCGFLISAYGSTVRRGEGRDLDLICVQKRIGVSPAMLLDGLAHELHGKIEQESSSLFAELCGMIRLPDGRLVDVQIRLSRCGPQDAESMYTQTPWGVRL